MPLQSAVASISLPLYIPAPAYKGADTTTLCSFIEASVAAAHARVNEPLSARLGSSLMVLRESA